MKNKIATKAISLYMTMQQQQFNKYFSLIFNSFVVKDLNKKINTKKKN